MYKIIDRIGEIITEKNLSIRAFEQSIEASNGAIGRAIKNRTDISAEWLSKIIKTYPDISAPWLISGTGSMYCVDNYINLEQNSEKECEACEVEELPVIPAKIVNAPDIDVYKYISDNENDLETAPVVQQFPDSKAFYRIKTKAMEPSICAGDMLALAAYPKGFERIVPGDPYSVDTNTNGLVTRLLYNHPDGFLARSYNPEKYPDFVIAREEIIRVFRIVGLLRINVQ